MDDVGNDAGRVMGLGSAAGIDPGLAIVAYAWPQLDDGDRKAILAVIRAATGRPGA